MKQHTPPNLPVDVALWNTADIAHYLRRAPAVVQSHIVCLPDFPTAIRLPGRGGTGRGRPLWKAREVVKWAETYSEDNTGGRPRS